MLLSAYRSQHKSVQTIVKSLAKAANASSPNIKPSGALPGIVCLDCIPSHLQSAFCYLQIGWQLFKFSFRKIQEPSGWGFPPLAPVFFLAPTRTLWFPEGSWGKGSISCGTEHQQPDFGMV